MQMPESMSSMPAEKPMDAEALAPPAGSEMASAPVAGPEIPPPPPGGYSKNAVTDFVTALQKAVKAVGKALGKEMPEIPDVPDDAFVKGKLDAEVPEGMAGAAVVVLGAAASIGGKEEGRYDLDVLSLLADDAGLDRLSIALELVARDKVMLDKLREIARQGPGPTASPPPPAAAKTTVQPPAKPMSGAAFA